MRRLRVARICYPRAHAPPPRFDLFVTLWLDQRVWCGASTLQRTSNALFQAVFRLTWRARRTAPLAPAAGVQGRDG
jgi:hypothetical protein